MQDDVIARTLELMNEEIKGLIYLAGLQNRVLLDLLVKSTAYSMSTLESAVATVGVLSDRAAQIDTKLAFLKQGAAM